MNKDYERNYSHSHCWNQKGKPACGQPLESHTQCCLCDLRYDYSKAKHKGYPPKEKYGRSPFGQKVVDAPVANIEKAREIADDSSDWEEEALKDIAAAVKGWIMKVDEGGTAYQESHQKIRNILRNLIQKEREEAYQEGFYSGKKLNSPVASIVSNARTETIKEIEAEFEKLTRYGTTKHSGNVWAYRTSDVEELFTKLKENK